MRDLLNLTADTAARYLENLDHRGVAPSPEAIAGLAELVEPLPELPDGTRRRARDAGSHRVAGDDGHGRPALLRIRHRRLAAGGAGGELAGRRLGPERRPGRRVAGRGRAGGGRAALAARRAADCPPTAAGAFVTGATMANFTALAAARHAVLARAGWDVEADGLFGAPPITVVVGDEAHPSLLKALGMLGLGRDARHARAGRRAGAHARRRTAAARAARRSSACRRAT